MKSLSRRDIIWSYLGQIANLTVHILLTPLIAIKLPSNELGLWYTFTSIYTLITFFDSSFTPLILRNAAYCISGAVELSKEGFVEQATKKPNYKLLNELMLASKKIYKAAALVFFALLITAGSPYILFITSGQIDRSIIGAWLIYATGIAINFYIIYLPAMIKGIGYVADGQKIFVYSRSIQLIFSVFGVMAGGGIYALSIGFFMGSVFIFILSVITAKKINILGFELVHNNYKINETIKIIWFNAKKMMFVTIGRYFSTQGGILICSTFISLETSGAYGLTIQALQAVASVSNIYLQTLIPAISSAAIRNDEEECRESFSAGMCMYWILYPIGALMVFLVCNPLLFILNAHTMLMNPLPYWIMSVGYFILSNYTNFNHYNMSQNYIPNMKSEFICGLLNLIIMIFVSCIFDFGIWGIILVQVLIPLCYNAWYWPHCVINLLNTNIIEMFHIGLNKIRKQFFRI